VERVDSSSAVSGGRDAAMLKYTLIIGVGDAFEREDWPLI